MLPSFSKPFPTFWYQIFHAHLVLSLSRPRVSLFSKELRFLLVESKILVLNMFSAYMSLLPGTVRGHR